jgi:GH25 family lysozyme M1 (1,4-beta-N-acetylmuramidase)
MDPVGIDLYEGDIANPDWRVYIDAGPPWHFAILKATQGTSYAPSWFVQNWEKMRVAASAVDRYGNNFFRGCYHYAKLSQSGSQQADYYLDFVERAGGWGDGDFPPIIDVEHANNEGATSDDVFACVTAFAERCNERIGKRPVLYGNSLLYDLGIREHMGCSKLWVARYASTLPAEVYERIGWSRDELFGWQYCGDGESYLDGYPSVSPLGKVDISALLLDGGGGNALTAAAAGAGLALASLVPAALGIAFGLTRGG